MSGRPETAPPSKWLNASVHLGRREHYRLARDLVARRPTRAVLIQRSSTLLLGPEEGWDHEADFHDEVWDSVVDGTRWYHVASRTGIERHLRRADSKFPSAAQRPAGLVTIGRHVAISGAGRHPAQPIKVLPEEFSGALGTDFKVDRQVRLVAGDLDAHSEALVVADIGDQQLTIRLRGETAQRLIEVCVDFYHDCPQLTEADLAVCLAAARTREEAPA